MNLLFLINSATAGGAENHALGLARGLQAAGHNVRLVALQEGDVRRRLVLEDVEGHDIPVKGLSQVVNWLRNTIGEHQVDLVISVNLKPLVVAQLASVRNRHLCIVHSFPALVFRSGWRNGLISLSWLAFSSLLTLFRRGRLDRFVFISRRQREAWSRVPPLSLVPGVVIPNGVDVRSDSGRDTPSLPEAGKALKIAMVAAFRVEKNHRLLIEAIRHLREVGARVKVALAGDGPLRSEIQTLVNDSGLADTVHFLGPLADCSEVYRWADITALASTSEAAPLVVLESMSCGTPVVAADVGGVSEQVVDGETGILFASEDTGQLVAAILKMMDPAVRSRMAEAALRRAREEFSLERMLRDYGQLIDSMVVGGD